MPCPIAHRGCWRRGWRGGFAVAIRSEPKQQPPYRPLADVMKAQQVVHTLVETDGILIGFRFPAAASSVNVPGWHFHFLSADKTRGGHVLSLTTGAAVALLEEFCAGVPRPRARVFCITEK